MRFEQDGEWTVSTPVYIGTDDQVAAAMACPHGKYAEVLRKVERGLLIVQEKCAGCVAARVRYRPAKAGDGGTAKEMEDEGGPVQG